MPNRKYEKGARFERKLVNAAKKKGFIAFRSAGSHSKVDVTTIDTEKCVVTFIQAKKGKSGMTKADKESFEANTNEYLVKFKVVSA